MKQKQKKKQLQHTADFILKLLLSCVDSPGASQVAVSVSRQNLLTCSLTDKGQAYATIAPIRPVIKVKQLSQYILARKREKEMHGSIV
jgi:hypothetical protein